MRRRSMMNNGSAGGGGFVLTDIGWRAAWDFTDSNNYTLVSSAYDSLIDISGNGNTIFATTPSERIPQEVFEGVPCANINDASEQRLNSTLGMLGFTTGFPQLSFFLVMRAETTNTVISKFAILGELDNTTQNKRVGFALENNGASMRYDGGFYATNFSLSNAVMTTACYVNGINYGDGKIYQNAALRTKTGSANDSTVPSYDSSISRFQIGDVNNGGSIGANVTLAFAGIFAGELTQQQLNNLQNYWASRFSSIPSV